MWSDFRRALRPSLVAADQKQVVALYIAGIQLDLSAFIGDFFNGHVHVPTRFYIDQGLAFWNCPVPFN
eukprot:15463632-Alexandrium_andersonii.AAC.1